MIFFQETKFLCHTHSNSCMNKWMFNISKGFYLLRTGLNIPRWNYTPLASAGKQVMSCHVGRPLLYLTHMFDP